MIDLSTIAWTDAGTYWRAKHIICVKFVRESSGSEEKVDRTPLRRLQIFCHAVSRAEPKQSLSNKIRYYYSSSKSVDDDRTIISEKCCQVIFCHRKTAAISIRISTVCILSSAIIVTIFLIRNARRPLLKATRRSWSISPISTFSWILAICEIFRRHNRKYLHRSWHFSDKSQITRITPSAVKLSRSMIIYQRYEVTKLILILFRPFLVWLLYMSMPVLIG